MTHTEQVKKKVQEFDKKFLYRLNQIALAHMDVALYADQENWLRAALLEIYSLGVKEGREKMIKLLPVIEVKKNASRPEFSFKFIVGQDYVETMPISQNIEEGNALAIVMKVIEATNHAYKQMSL